MPEHLRALIVIVALASAALLAVEKTHLFSANSEEIRRLRNLWLASTLAAFLSHSFWLYALVETFLIVVWSTRAENKTAIFFLLLFVIPPSSIQVPGLGLINHFFDMNQPRLLSILLLAPCVLTAKRAGIGRSPIPDSLFLSYILLTVILELRQTTFTDAMRFGFHTFLDSVLPYYAFSRSLKEISAFRQTLLCFVLACIIISFVAMFEVMKSWLLYGAVPGVLGLGFAGAYSGRADMLRAAGPAGHPIALGYVMMVAIGFYLFLMRNGESARLRRLGLAILVGGLIAALSRGPWLGALVLVGIFLATSLKPLRNLMLFGLAGVLAVGILSVLPGGEKYVNLLPYMGTTEVANIEYREKLFDNAVIVILRNFWFGSVDYLQTWEMQEMMQGQGIIDIVNTYLEIALNYGVIGLTLFVLFFVSTIVGIWNAMGLVPSRNSAEYLLGRSLLATTIAILFTVATVSSIMNNPIIYWSVAGLSVGYARMIRNPPAGQFGPILPKT